MSTNINSQFFSIVPQNSPILSVSQFDSGNIQSSYESDLRSPFPPEEARSQSTPFFRNYTVSLQRSNSSLAGLKALNEDLDGKNLPVLQALPSFKVESDPTKAYSVFVDHLNQLLHLSWKVRNTGKEAWPQGMYIEGSARSIIPRAKPGDVAHIQAYMPWPDSLNRDFLRIALNSKCNTFYLYDDLPFPKQVLEKPLDKEYVPSFQGITPVHIPKNAENFDTNFLCIAHPSMLTLPSLTLCFEICERVIELIFKEKIYDCLSYLDINLYCKARSNPESFGMGFRLLQAVGSLLKLEGVYASHIAAYEKMDKEGLVKSILYFDADEGKTYELPTSKVIDVLTIANKVLNLVRIRTFQDVIKYHSIRELIEENHLHMQTHEFSFFLVPTKHEKEKIQIVLHCLNNLKGLPRVGSELCDALRNDQIDVVFNKLNYFDAVRVAVHTIGMRNVKYQPHLSYMKSVLSEAFSLTQEFIGHMPKSPEEQLEELEKEFESLSTQEREESMTPFAFQKKEIFENYKFLETRHNKWKDCQQYITRLKRAITHLARTPPYKELPSSQLPDLL